MKLVTSITSVTAVLSAGLARLLQESSYTVVVTDRLYGTLPTAPAAGDAHHASQTLEAVEALLARHPGERSAAEVAAELGVSRATAQRYLAQLRDAGRVTMTLRYGTAGRPEHRYRARSDGPAGS